MNRGLLMIQRVAVPTTRLPHDRYGERVYPRHTYLLLEKSPGWNVAFESLLITLSHHLKTKLLVNQTELSLKEGKTRVKFLSLGLGRPG